jgi:hypothetical protein
MAKKVRVMAKQVSGSGCEPTNVGMREHAPNRLALIAVRFVVTRQQR